MRMNQLLAPVAALALCQGAAQAASWSRTTQAENIQVAAFRFQMHPYEVGPRPKKVEPISSPPGYSGKSNVNDPPIKVYFLSVDGRDPSNRVMKQFAGHKPPVKKASQAIIDRLPTDWGYSVSVRDKKTRETGRIYEVDRIHWLSHRKVIVETRQRDVLTFRLRGGHWKVMHIEHGPVF